MEKRINWSEIIKWAKIILEVVVLISGGMTKETAVNCVAEKFGVSAKRIWLHGGF
jgi:uncharacterized SAM-binding protein YcdF (DUF218 family)